MAHGAVMTAGLSGQYKTLSRILFPRAWASSTPPTCAVLDGRAPNAKLGQPGRPLSRSRGSCAQNSMGIERENVSRGVLSWVNQKGILPSRRMKCGATDCNPVQWIAPTRRLSRFARLAVSGRKRQPNIGRTTRACSPAWRNTGLQVIEFQTRGAWRSSVCSHNPHPASANNGEHPTRKGTLTD
jgi:hypothetical protein